MPTERFKIIPAAHLLLIRDGKILLLKRANTGFYDGSYSVFAGHLDGGETATSAMIREANEECGISLNSENLKMVHAMHRKSSEERVDFFFMATEWDGEPINTEKNKCDDLSWFSLNNLPNNIVPYVKHGIVNFNNGVLFSEFGWD
jgi:ADP-ribose pyrophosphatase YjhB (NUDIX family)